MTFTANKTKRFEHCVGVMHLAGKMFSSAVVNTREDDLTKMFEIVCDELIAWLENDATSSPNKATSELLESMTLYDINFKDTASFNITSRLLERSGRTSRIIPATFYDRSMPANVLEKWRYLYAILYQGIRIAGLIHDIGHLPYSHTVEDVLDSLYLDINEKLDSDKRIGTTEEQFHLSIAHFCDRKGDSKPKYALHESIGYELIRVVESDTYTAIENAYRADGEKNVPIKDKVFLLYAFMIARRVLRDKNKDSNGKRTIYTSFHPIISGMLDADRLDYVSRDLVSSAVSTDIVLYDRLFLGLLFRKDINDKNNDTYKLAILAKTTSDIEDVLRRRWRIYKDINLHHSVHRTELIMKDVLIDMAKQTFALVDSYRKYAPRFLQKNWPKRDDDFIAMVMSILSTLENPYKDGKQIEKNNHKMWCKKISDAFLVFDDAWLDTLLKRAHGKKSDNKKLRTLVTNNEEYTSVIKRYDDFWAFDEDLYKVISEDTDLTQEYKEACDHFHRLSADDKHLKYPQKLERILKALQHDLDKPLPKHPEYNTWRESPSKHLLFDYFRNAVYKDQRPGQWINEFMCYYSKKLNGAEDEKKARDAIIIGDIAIKTGINDDLILVRRRDPNGQWTFNEMSALDDHLKAEKALIPSFHLYCHREDADSQKVRIEIINFVKKKIIDSIKEARSGCPVYCNGLINPSSL